jgi:putative ABC transport system permease protein
MSDIRDAVRALKATPVVTAVAILSLALGIGANTAIFSILDSLVLRSLPVREPGRLALLSHDDNRSWTYAIWDQIRQHEQRFDGALAAWNTRFNLSQAGPTEFVDGLWASGSYFDVLGVQAILGRTFTRDDERRGGGPDGPVAVISHGFWQRRFTGAADVVGRSITVEGIPFTIVGVTGPDFSGTDVGRTFDIALPLGAEPLVHGKDNMVDQRATWWLNIMIRLAPGQTIESAQRTLAGIQPQIREATIPEHFKEEDKATYLIKPLELSPAATGNSSLRRRYQQPLNTIMVVVALVLLIACANIANLLLARGTARRHEMSVRLALGASRFRLTRQLMVESLLLAACGAALGLYVAIWGSRLLVRQLAGLSNTVFLDLSIDTRIMLFTAAVTVLTAVLFGTAPALRATNVQPNDVLKEQGRGIAGENRFGLGNLLVVVQVALSLVLIVAAGLFVRTFSSLAGRDLGFDAEPVIVASLDLQGLERDPNLRLELYERFRSAAAAVPGVSNAAISFITPVSGTTWNNPVQVEGAPDRPEQERGVYRNLVSPGWFAAYQTRLIAGRDFLATDRRGAPEVVIVNEAFARKFTGGANPVGKRVFEEGYAGRPDTWREIVGLVEDAVYSSPREETEAIMYAPLAQAFEAPPFGAISVSAATGSPALLTRPLADALMSVDRNVPITFRPLARQVDESLAQERLVAMLSGFFGALALLLAGLGLYGVTSYAVGRRRREIGIRMALGAAPGGVIRMVILRVGVLVGAGAIAGTAISLWAARFVGPLLYGLEPRDPATLGAAVIVLAVIGAMAGLIPAARASRIDPAIVLRE